MTHAQDEGALWASAAGGNRDALGILLMRHAARLGFRARAAGLRDADVTDAVQETFVRALVRWRDLRNQETLGPWLERIVGNVAIDWTRRRRRHPEPDRAPEHRIPPEIDAELDRLSEGDRALLHLRYFEGLTGPEMAARLGLPLETVKKRLQRARAAALRARVVRE